MRFFLPISTYPDATPVDALEKIVTLAAALGASAAAAVHHTLIPNINNPAAEFILHLEAMSDAAEASSRARAKTLTDELYRLCHAADVALSTESVASENPVGETIAAMARVFDVTALAVSPDSPQHALLTEDALFGSGGPILIVGGSNSPCHLRAISIAWDGSRAAARALRDAVPLLKRTQRVTLLTCSEDKPITPASIDGVFDFLKAHDIAIEHFIVGLDGETVGDALQRTAISLGSGVLVMGAYGHSRIREFILGGATSAAMRRPRLAIFMSH